jgi:hypothetical protein
MIALGRLVLLPLGHGNLRIPVSRTAARVLLPAVMHANALFHSKIPQWLLMEEFVT